MLIYSSDRYKTQNSCDKDVDDFQAALKFIPDWCVITKMIRKLVIALYADDNIFYFNEDFSDAMFFCNEMGILSVDLNNINLNDINHDKNDPETIIHVRNLAWYSKFEKCKALKKELNEELMLVTWQPLRWWGWCLP